MNKNNQTIDRAAIVDALANFRQTWEQGTDGEDLVDTFASVGLILGDLVLALGLNETEQVAALGEHLQREFFKTINMNDWWPV